MAAVERSRADVALAWTNAMVGTAYVPMSRGDVERSLRDLLDRVVELLAADEFVTAPAVEIGIRLVRGYFIGQDSLGRTFDLFSQQLPELPELRAVDGLAYRMMALTGAVATGYVTAMRERTLDQQETVKLALLKACEKAQRDLRSSETRFRELFASSAIGIAMSDLDGKLLEVNQALGDMVGRPATELIGQSLHELFHPDDAPALVAAHDKLVHEKKHRFRLDRQLRLMDADGEPSWTYLAVSLLHDADGHPARYVTMVEDVTELHLLGERLSHQSLHDALTGLPNQQFFISTLESLVGRGNQASTITLFKIDLDGFTVVNDGLGRDVGDQLLRSVAGRLRSMLTTERATVARFGADEFAVLIENSATTPAVSALAEHINNELAEPVYIDGKGLAVSSCIGVVEHRGGAAEPAELLRAAEATLRRLKSTGPRQWGMFDVHRDADERARSRLAAVMPSAWENGEINLEYQPLASLADGTVVGMEPLLRWDHPTHGPMSHRECLALAEETGLMLPLGQWMLGKACEQLAEWHRRYGSGTPTLHFDLTMQQAHDPDLVSTVRNALVRAGDAGGRLQIGMPAPALNDEAGEAGDNLGVLVGIDVPVGLVDCGGAADLLHLDELPVRSVRITPRLVRRSRPSSMATRALTNLLPLIRSYGVTVIVGDIRTGQQARWWHSVGADAGQGPFFADPAPPDRVIVELDTPLVSDHEN